MPTYWSFHDEAWRYLRISATIGKTAAGIVQSNTPNPPTNIVDFRGFDSSIILISRGGIPRPIGDFSESLSRAMLVGTMLVGRLDVQPQIAIHQGDESFVSLALEEAVRKGGRMHTATDNQGGWGDQSHE